MTITGIEKVIKQNALNQRIDSAKAAVFTQISKIDPAKRAFLSERAKDAASRLAEVSLDHARTPGFFKSEEAARVMAYVSGRADTVPDSFEILSRKSKILSTVFDNGSISGGRMELGYRVNTGNAPLDLDGHAKMTIVTRFLNRSMTEYRDAFSALRESNIESRHGALARMAGAEEDVIANAEVYLAARNDLASRDFDVSSFDKNAEKASLLVLAVRHYELNPSREISFQSKVAKAAKPSSMSLN